MHACTIDEVKKNIKILYLSSSFTQVKNKIVDGFLSNYLKLSLYTINILNYSKESEILRKNVKITKLSFKKIILEETVEGNKKHSNCIKRYQSNLNI